MNDDIEKTEGTESAVESEQAGNAVPNPDRGSNAPQRTSVPPMSSGGIPGAGAKPGGGLPGLGGGGLPGLGVKPGGGLPGLGGKPGGGLPGIGGGGLPGMGAKPGGGLPGVGGGGLPGMGAKPGGGLPGVAASGIPAAGAPVPGFIQKQQEQARQAAMARDPFAATNLPATRPSYIPDAHGDGIDTGPPVEMAKNRKPLILGAVILGLIFMLFGYFGGIAVYTRGLLNTVLRDAWIIQYEMNKLRTLHGEVQGMVNVAIAEGRQKKFHEGHVEYLADKVRGNPFDARLFTERNFKSLHPMVVQMMASLYRNWNALSVLIAEHRAATNNDMATLKAAGDEFKKLLETNYGVVFRRSKETGQLEANIVIIGAGESAGTVQIQLRPGTFGDERELYSPDDPDDKLTRDPEKYVVLVGAQSKQTILQNATQSHFNTFMTRLEEMLRVLKVMEEEQQNMFGPLDNNCSREPVSFFARGVDPKAEFDEYRRTAESRAGASSGAE